MAESRSNLKIVIVVAVVVILVLMMLWVVLAYNSTVSQEQSVNSTSSDIKNRYTVKVDTMSELVPQLDGFAEYESSLLTNITQLRTAWLNALDNGDDVPALENISNQIDTQFAALYAVYENYPSLQYGALVSQYMGEVVDLNEALAFARGEYNDAVQEYNSSIKSFPMMLFASSFGFEERDYWGSERPGEGSNL